MIVCVLSESQRREYGDELREIAHLDGNLVFIDSAQNALSRIGKEKPAVVVVSFDMGAVERSEFLAMLSVAESPYDGPVVVLPSKAGGLPTVVYTHECPAHGGPAEEVVRVVGLLDFVVSVVKPKREVSAAAAAEEAAGGAAVEASAESRMPESPGGGVAEEAAKSSVAEPGGAAGVETAAKPADGGDAIGVATLLGKSSEPPADPVPRPPPSLEPLELFALPSAPPSAMLPASPEQPPASGIPPAGSRGSAGGAAPSPRGGAVPRSGLSSYEASKPTDTRHGQVNKEPGRRAIPFAAIAFVVLAAIGGYWVFSRSARPNASDRPAAVEPTPAVDSRAWPAVMPSVGPADLSESAPASAPPVVPVGEVGEEGEPVFVRVLPLAFERTSTWPVLTSMKVLSEIVAELKRDPEATIELVGHTSDDGNRKPDVDNFISRVRAEAAKAVLVGQGIKPERFKIRSASADEMLAPNDTERNRRRNRRVVIKMYGH